MHFQYTIFMSTKSQSYVDLKSAIESKQFKLGVVGLGYVGLPLVFEFVSSGISVIGVDVNQEKIISFSVANRTSKTFQMTKSVPAMPAPYLHQPLIFLNYLK